MRKKTSDIGLFSAVAIGVGGMVGAGIFSLLGVAATIAGNATFIAFIIAGAIALLSSYSYAQLGKRFPSAGGPVEFVIKGLGKGILSGGLNIMLWMGYVFVLAVYARAFAEYAFALLPKGSNELWINALVTLNILAFVGINYLGARAVGVSELIIVVLKVGVLLLFAAAAFFYADATKIEFAPQQSATRILYASGIIFMAYEGFGLITNSADDMKHPQKTLPKALYWSVLITMLIYVFVSLAVFGNLSVDRLQNAKEYALAEAAEPLFGQLGFTVMAIAALFSTSSAINATLYGATNTCYLIARRGQLPKWLGENLSTGIPKSLLATGLLVIAVANSFQLTGIALLGSATFLISYAMVNFAHTKLHKETDTAPWIIWLAAVSCFIFFGFLIYYELNHNFVTLLVFCGVLLVAFLSAWLYQKFANN